MRLNNFMFETKYAYTYAEVINYWLDGFAIDESDIVSILTAIGYAYEDEHGVNNSELGLSFIEEGALSNRAFILFNKIYARYKDHYAIFCKTDKNEEYVEQIKKFMKKLFNIMDYTFPKYNKLFALYSSQESHLLDKLERTKAETKSTTESVNASGEENGVHLFNDTPQTSDVVANIEGNQYVSELNKDHVASSSSGQKAGSEAGNVTESHDPETIMERLKEIKDKYAMLFREWLDEFDGLFVEEVNYE